MRSLDINLKREIRTTLFIFLLIFPHVEPGHFNVSGSIVDNIYNILKILSTLFVVGYYIYFCIKNKYLNKIVIAVLAYCGFVVINTFIQFGINRFNLVVLVSSGVLAMVIDCFSKKHAKELVHAFLILFELLLVSNFFVTLFSNSIEDSCHFLGNRNLLIVYFSIALCLSLIWKEYKGKSIRFWILFALCWATLFIRGLSVTSFFCLILFTILYFTRIYKFKYFNISTAFIAYLILFAVFVLFRVQNYMGDFFAAVGKNVTFSGRTGAWDKTLKLISQSPIFGYGAVDNAAKKELMGYAHAHNYLLEQLLQGGIIQVGIIAVFFIFVIRNMKAVKNQIQTKYIILSISVIFLHLVVEAADIPLYWTLFMFASVAPEICQQLPSKEKFDSISK